MRDDRRLVAGGQIAEGKTEEELERDYAEEDRERQAFIDAWKAMYRRKGIDPDTYCIDWNTVFAGGRRV